MLTCMNIKHELPQRPFEPREVTAQYRKACPGEFGRPLEIHQSKGFANFEMLFRLEGIFRLLAMHTVYDIAMFILAIGNIGKREIWQHFQCPGQLVGNFTFGLLSRLDEVLQLGNIRLQLFGERQVLASHRLADLFGSRIAAGLGFLQFSNDGAALVIQRYQHR